MSSGHSGARRIPVIVEAHHLQTVSRVSHGCSLDVLPRLSVAEWYHAAQTRWRTNPAEGRSCQRHSETSVFCVQADLTSREDVDLADCIDMLDALHPQTLLACGMNGRDLSVPHGAPVRLRVETQLGYKSMKYLQRIVVTDDFDDGGKKGNIQNGWSWYAGI